MKYAIVESGGKQYIAREGEEIEVDRLPLEVGKAVTFKEVMLFADNGNVKVGNPYVKGVTIKGTVVAEIKAPKIIVFKYIPKERYRKKQGHRQRYSRVLIDSITTRAPRKKAEEAEEKETKTAKPKKPAAKPAAPKEGEAAAKPEAADPEAKSAEPKPEEPKAEAPAKPDSGESEKKEGEA